jgi:hypothetical protein
MAVIHDPAWTLSERFLVARGKYLRYLRDVEHASWSDIAFRLSCDPQQVADIYEATAPVLPAADAK